MFCITGGLWLSAFSKPAVWFIRSFYSHRGLLRSNYPISDQHKRNQRSLDVTQFTPATIDPADVFTERDPAARPEVAPAPLNTPRAGPAVAAPEPRGCATRQMVTRNQVTLGGWAWRRSSTSPGSGSSATGWCGCCSRASLALKPAPGWKKPSRYFKQLAAAQGVRTATRSRRRGTAWRHRERH